MRSRARLFNWPRHHGGGWEGTRRCCRRRPTANARRRDGLRPQPDVTFRGGRCVRVDHSFRKLELDSSLRAFCVTVVAGHLSPAWNYPLQSSALPQLCVSPCRQVASWLDDGLLRASRKWITLRSSKRLAREQREWITRDRCTITHECYLLNRAVSLASGATQHSSLMPLS